jgi:DNA-binding NtrC family response regulator
VRVIAATSRDLERAVADGRFRSDLFYRLNVLPIRLPALRERVEDLEALCEHLLERIAADNGQLPKEIDRDALRLLAGREWPGNIRELRNVLEQACSFWDGLRLSPEAFRTVALPGAGGSAASGAQAGVPRPLQAQPAVRQDDAVPVLNDPVSTDALPARVFGEVGASSLIFGDGPRGPLPTPGSAASADGLTLPQRIARLEREAIAEALRATGGNRSRAARRLGISRATLYEKLAGIERLSDFRTTHPAA